MSMIYTPAGRAREYAALACNIYRGCDHRCTYCYAPSAIRMNREEFGQPQLRPYFRSWLARELRRNPGHGERVLLSFTCDPYQHFDVEHEVTRTTITLLHNAGHNIQVLTKGGTRALRDLDLFTPADAFATTMTLLDESESLKWEPGAALPADRIETIQRFHEAGIPTWISLEPVLDPDAALKIICQTHDIVDLYKIGKLNYHALAGQIDWQAFGLTAIALCEQFGTEYYVKADLLALLPAGSLGQNHVTANELDWRDGPRVTAQRTLF